MVLSVEMACWDDTYESTARTTRAGGGDRSERVHGITRANVNDLQAVYST